MKAMCDHRAPHIIMRRLHATIGHRVLHTLQNHLVDTGQNNMQRGAGTSLEIRDTSVGGISRTHLPLRVVLLPSVADDERLALLAGG